MEHHQNHRACKNIVIHHHPYLSTEMKNPIYILIPVHNRKSITLSCLERLQQQGALDRYHIVVIDDGSTDGTAEAISQQYPSVNILPGSGNLWWTGAIVMGMKFAMNQGAKYLIWLNDDTLPEEGSIERLITACIHNPRTIASAQCYEDDTYQQGSFGGHKINLSNLSSEIGTTDFGQRKIYDCLSGNMVCFPRKVVETIGYPNHHWMPQGSADIVYTFAAKEAGFFPTVIGSSRAVCPMNPIYQSWFEGPISIRQRWAMLFTPKSNLYPPTYIYGNIKIYGLRGIISSLLEYQKFILVTLIILMVPKSLIERLRDWVRTRKQVNRFEHQEECQHRLTEQANR
jgi:GT2 family glycosyltransferase